MRTEFDKSLLVDLNEKTESEQLYLISKYFSIFFLNDFDRVPSNFEKYEALIFANVYHLYFLMRAGYKPSEDEKGAIINGLISEMDADLFSQTAKIDEFGDFQINRINLYLKEIKKLSEPDNLPLLLLDKLYINPLSSSKEGPELDLIGAMRYFIILTESIKSFDNALKQVYPSMNA